MNMSEPPWESVADLLAREGVAVPVDAEERLKRFAGLVERFGLAMSLVSRGDRGELWARHFVDSLSLAPWVKRWAGPEGMLDAGSGGGFPALVVKAVVPAVPMVLVERSSRKAGFLRMAAGELGYEGVEVICGELKDMDMGGAGQVITARAIERPDQVAGILTRRVQEGGVWLCQSGARLAEGLSGVGIALVRDSWTEQRWRRGELYIVRAEEAESRCSTWNGPTR